MTRRTAYPNLARFSLRSRASSFEAASASESPVISTSRTASGSPSRKPIIREYSRFARACLRIIESTSSTEAGATSRVGTVASTHSWRVWKWRTASALWRGRGTIFTLASVTVSRVPSEPTTNLAMSSPAAGSDSSSRLYPETRRWICGKRAATSSLVCTPISARLR